MSKRTALVTGASRGIGKAIAQRLAHDGAHVLLVARGVGELEAVEREIRDSGGSVETVAADVTERARTESIAADVLARHGVLDILVNNAGGNVRQSAEEMPLKTWDQILALCLTAPFQWSRLFASSMREQGFGRIVNIGSVAGMRALSTGAAYATAKAGLEQLTRSLARAWGADGVTVNCIAPWYVRTPLTEGVLSDPSYLHAVLACTPTGRLGRPGEIASAVSFLAGDEAGWINGVTLPMDGGMTASSFFPPTA